MKKRTMIKMPRIIAMHLIALLLVVSTILPSTATAFEGEEITVSLTTSGVITEEKIKNSSQIITLKLENNTWATNLNKDLIIQSMFADVEKDAWLKYRTKVDVKIDQNDQSKLNITLPSDSSYEVKENQTISFNLNAAVIENWPGEVKVVPASFTIYATPELFIEGSITTATIDDIRKGGKEIDLVLLNAEWNKEEFEKQEGLLNFLKGFNVSGSSPNLDWAVVNELKLYDPNDLYSLPNASTLRIKLPAMPHYKNEEETVTFLLDSNNVGYYAVNTVEGEGLSSPINSNPEFTIKKSAIDSTKASLAISTSQKVGTGSSIVINGIKEEDFKNTNLHTEIILTLDGVTWKVDSEAKKNVLKEAFTTSQQQADWNEVKKLMTVTQIDDQKVIVTVPGKLTDNNYKLIANQLISFTPPVQLLSESISVGKQTFTIKATPKALISGNATPIVSQADIVKGGKEILITLVNAEWVTNVAANGTIREQLLSSLEFPGTNVVNIQNTHDIIKAEAVVTKKDRTVSIKLPEVQGFKGNGEVKFKPNIIKNLTVENDQSFNINEVVAFNIDPVTNQSVSLSGNDIRNLTDFDLKTGGQKFSLTLKNDTWTNKKDLSSISIMTEKGDFISYDVVRRSDTIADITLTSTTLTSDADVQVNISIPNDLLNLRVASTPLKIENAFKVSKVTADLSGTGTSLDAATVQSGGKTLIITLENAVFKANADLTQLIFSASDAINWNLIKSKIDSKDITVRGNKATIKLPAVPNYESPNGNSVGIIVPKELIDHENATDISVKGSISIGQVGGAQISVPSLEESSIKSSEQTLTITLTGTKWDSSIATNSSKQSSLLKGFKVNDQTKEWTLVTNAIKKEKKFELSNNNATLTITIPAVPEYSIIRNQVVDIVIPKSVLVDYKYDIQANPITITVPNTPVSDKTFRELLSEGIEAADLEKIRIFVPEKKVETIYVNTTDFPGTGPGSQNDSLTTVEITANSEVNKVEVTVKGSQGEQVKEVTGSNKFLFVFSNIEKNSELKVTVYGAGSDPLQADIYKKIGKGSKTYNELPKKNLTGSYSLYSLLTDKSLLKDILKDYTIDELKVQQQ